MREQIIHVTTGVNGGDSMRSAVFLDRDGVLVGVSIQDGKPLPPTSLATCVIVPGAPKALLALSLAGFCLVLVTNRPDIASGSVSVATVEAMHEMLQNSLPLDAIYVCPHRDRDQCECRKPKPGLLLQAAKDLLLNVSTSYMIGDQEKDVEAGKRAGCATLLLDTSYNRLAFPDVRVTSLTDAVAWILKNEYRER